MAWGYFYTLPLWKHLQASLGGIGTMALVPASLYGDYEKNPLSFSLFLRLKLI